MSGEHRELDPILARVVEALSFVGAGDAAGRVSAALDQAGISHGDMLLFIPIFLAFYADTGDLDVAQLMQNIQAETERTLKAVKRLRLELIEKYQGGNREPKT